MSFSTYMLLLASLPVQSSRLVSGAVILPLYSNLNPRDKNSYTLDKRDNVVASGFHPWRGRSQLELYTRIAIGTPPQHLNVVIATDPIIYISSPNRSLDAICEDATTIASNSTCFWGSFSGLYNSTASTTLEPLNEDFSLDLSAASFPGYLVVNGEWGTDNITLGNSSLDSVPFVYAYNSTLPSKLGLGIRSELEFTGPTYIELLQRENFINTMAYSVYFGNRRSDISAGAVYLGAIDTNKFYGPLRTFPSPDGETLTVTGVYLITQEDGQRVNKSLMPNPQYQATGILTISGEGLGVPDEIFGAILGTLFPDALIAEEYDNPWRPADANDDFQAYDVSCDSNRPAAYLQLAFNGTLIDVQPNDFLQKWDSSSPLWKNGTDPADINYEFGLCEVLLHPRNSTAPGSFLLGTPFFRSAYVAIDYSFNTTSIAQAVSDSNTSNVTEIGFGNSPIGEFTGLPDPRASEYSLVLKPTITIIAAIIGIIIIATFAVTVFCVRKVTRIYPNLPLPPVAPPYEVDSRVLPPPELGNRSPVELISAYWAELPTNRVAAVELPGNSAVELLITSAEENEEESPADLP